ncbi:hypothetical protein PI125_g1835 [Phytophthora idaei]|nr:hypothetical protein PI125_g1835 [Phytophthora idaei]
MTLYFEDNETTTIRDLIKKMRDTREPYKYGVDEVTLYLAKRDGEWLRRDAYDVDLLVRGEFPDSMKALLNENNKMDFGSLAIDRKKNILSRECAVQLLLVQRDVPVQLNVPDQDYWYGAAVAIEVVCFYFYEGEAFAGGKVTLLCRSDLQASRLLEHTFLLVRPGNCKLNALAKRSDKRATT